MLVIVAPGQGAQTPGFLTPWLELDSFATHLASLSDAVGIDLAQHGTTSAAETIRDTAVAQPLLVAAGLATHKVLHANADGLPADVLAGHSVGEITAAALAGVFSESDGMRFVGQRGRGMATAAAQHPTSMSAVVAGKPDEVLAAIEASGCTAANNNGAGQVVAAGTLEQLQRLADAPPPRARVIPLSVAGAFHTVHMEPAIAPLQEVTDTIEVADPQLVLLSNADGSALTRGSEYIARLVSQVAHPVRWDLCMVTMAELGVTGLLELTPAGTLTGIAKRNLKEVELFSLNTPDQLSEAAAFVRSHASSIEQPA